jgi:hypothetical protein
MPKIVAHLAHLAQLKNKSNSLAFLKAACPKPILSALHLQDPKSNVDIPL